MTFTREISALQSFITAQPYQPIINVVPSSSFLQLFLNNTGKSINKVFQFIFTKFVT